MRKKLALTIALVGFAVVTALGVGMAGADPSVGLGDSQAANGILTTPALPSAQTPACANQLDDDEDGLADLEDSDCESASDTRRGVERNQSLGGAPTPPLSVAPPRLWFR